MRDPMLNAFALPGGFIGVHSGLVLGARQSESELAVGAGARDRRTSSSATSRACWPSSSDVDCDRHRRAAAGAAGGAQQLQSSGDADARRRSSAARRRRMQQQLNFSREAEREADRVGFQMLVNAGFDARAAWRSFFGRLQQATRIYESGTRRPTCAPTR
ncbi:MAG: hypothetical protein MZW92_35460 [Comamonadaceae bacterium]|nr:hypothetical protein [Comamonadaceae bacterium]